MSKFEFPASFQRLRNKYRLVIINDDSYEEVATFTLNRVSVYIAICTIFILLIGATVALLWFTPLKQLTPGYKQGFGVDAKYKQLKIASDSVFKISEMQQKYIQNIQTLLLDKQPVVPAEDKVLQIFTPDTALESKPKNKLNEN